MYRSVSLKFASGEELQQFLELLPKYVDVEYYAVTRGTNVYIQLSGPPDEVRRAVASIKTAAGLVRAELKPIKSYPLEAVFREADVASPVPPDVLVEYLAVRGFKARLRGPELQTDASMEEVKRAASQLSAVYKSLEGVPVSPHAKRVAAVYIAAVRSRPEEALERLAAAGILNRGSVFSLALDLQTARRRVRALIGKS
ncbi:MAG: DUF2067 domain-containing protein [Thermoproteus sp.]|jgi:hypothetical protein